jgi:hypothetical protein
LRYLAELLSLPNSAAELNLCPQRKREKLFGTLVGPPAGGGQQHLIADYFTSIAEGRFCAVRRASVARCHAPIVD